jgi:hypothetical protein
LDWEEWNPHSFHSLQPTIQVMPKDTFRVVTRGADGQLRIRDYSQPDVLYRLHTQIGVDDCSTDLGLRGLPVFRGLIGPMPEGKNIIRYESPEVFEVLTKEWSNAKSSRRSRMRTIEQPLTESAQNAELRA